MPANHDNEKTLDHLVDKEVLGLGCMGAGSVCLVLALIALRQGYLLLVILAFGMYCMFSLWGGAFLPTDSDFDNDEKELCIKNFNRQKNHRKFFLVLNLGICFTQMILHYWGAFIE